MRRNWAVIVASGIALCFIALPIGGLVASAPWASASDLLFTTQVRQALVLSLLCSTAAAALALLLGIPLAALIADQRTPARSAMRAMCALTLVLPPVVAGVALLSAFGPQGLVGRYLYDWFGVQLTFSTAGTVTAQTFVALPFVVLTAEAAFRAVDPNLVEAARSFGVTRAERFRTVVFPAIRPSIIAGGILAWARALGEFGASITFAGNLPGRTQTLPLAVYELNDSNPGAAIMLSLLLVAIALVVLVALRNRWTGVFG